MTISSLSTSENGVRSGHNDFYVYHWNAKWKLIRFNARNIHPLLVGLSAGIQVASIPYSYLYQLTGVLQMASILSKKNYWLRGSKMVWNVEKTNKKFAEFFRTVQVYRKIAKCWVGHSKNFYWLRGSRMVQNMEKTAKKFSDFFKVKVKFDDLENVTEKPAMSIC